MSRLTLILVAASFSLILGCAPQPAPTPIAENPKSTKSSNPKPKKSGTQKSTAEVLSQLPGGDVPVSTNSAPNTAAIQTTSLSAQINGKTFPVKNITLLKFKESDKATSNGATDEAQKYHLEIMDGSDTFDSENQITIIFATDFKLPLQNHKINWKPAKFGSPEASKQSYPKPGTSVGRGIYFVNFESPSGSDMISDEISATLSFGKTTPTTQDFTINLTAKGIQIKGSATATYR